MIKAVVDTNVLISGFIWGGTPKKIIDKFRFERSFLLVFSPELIHEFRGKLLHKFHLRPELVNQWVEELSLYTELVIPELTAKICRDPKDNMILDTAKSTSANYIVTGDKDLLSLRTFSTITIVSPKEFLVILTRNGI